jgi:hypothetical protein
MQEGIHTDLAAKGTGAACAEPKTTVRRLETGAIMNLAGPGAGPRQVRDRSITSNTREWATVSQQISRTGPAAGGRRDLWWRWTLAMAGGELLGFSIPAAAGALTYALETSEAWQAIVVTLAGAGEGAVVGLAQWWVLRRALPGLARRSWVVPTALAALLAWACAMLAMNVANTVELPPAAMAAGGAVLGLLFVGSMGTAQWLVLRRSVARAGWWIPANALAWPLGVLVPVAGLSLVPDGAPAAVMFAVGLLGGVLMGLLVGALTGLVLVALLYPGYRSGVDVAAA